MRAWGIQKFLNAPAHEDNGFLIAHVQGESKYWKRISANLTVADCDRRAHLDFGTDGVRQDSKNSREDIAQAYRSNKQRREKARILRDVVDKFCEKLELALDEELVDIAAVEEALDSKE